MDVIAKSDIVYTATSAVDYIVDKNMMEENGLAGGKPLMLVDIAVPRNVGVDCNELPSVYAYNVDDLKAVVAKNTAMRQREMIEAELVAMMHSMAMMSASAFHAPVVPAARTSVSMMAKSQALPFAEAPAALDGSMPGDVGFDPLGFSDYTLGPFESSAEHMGWMREAELKHGRVCMLGVVGWIVADMGVRAPGMPAELKAASSSFAAHDIAVADGRLLMLLILCGVFEIAGAGAIKATLDGKREAGDFALMGGFSKVDGKRLAALKQAEVKHARLGMMAFSGIATQTAVASATGGSVAFPYLDF